MCTDGGTKLGLVIQDARLAHAQLDNLVGKWRQSANAFRQHKISGASTMDDCADQLADALTEIYSDHEL